MAYIASDNLLPTGIEVYTTDISEQLILEEQNSFFQWFDVVRKYVKHSIRVDLEIMMTQ
jgi:hypothetical protein